ncbi:MAG TPA: nicotinate phosphoribosyltransferase [Thermomicrobiales bacterium]|nr:nicotinate phosphoribosyltransferase [Thermomicrobiales bacterium]
MSDSRRGLVDEPGHVFSGEGDHLFLPESTAFFVDLYHIDAAYLAWKGSHTGTATFDLYTRSNPFAGGFMLVAGLEPALDYLQRFSYDDEQLAYLERVKQYEPEFLKFLSEMRFTGDIYGIPEGEIAFPNEPILRVTAPFPEAMIVESGLLRAIGVSTLIATKAARLALAAGGASIADFAFRRAHAPHIATRAGYIGGCDSTSFVAGAMEYDIPPSGTIPHALVQAYPTEIEAFRAVAASLPAYSLLLDTYSVERGIENAITVATEESSRSGHRLTAVRLDSGDLIEDSQMVRRCLDAAGLHEVRVLVSGDIDEYRIEEILGAGAPVDGFGVGGNLGVGLGTIDSGTVGGVIGAVYKLVWFDSDEFHPSRIKLAGGKSTWPGRKQAYRIGNFERDVVQIDREPQPVGGRPLLLPIVENGIRVSPEETVQTIRQRALASLDSLPQSLRELTPSSQYPVEMSERLLALRQETIERYQQQVANPAERQ